MAVLDVVNQQNEKVDSVEVSDAVFARMVNTALLHEAVVMQMASLRQGTAATKTKGLVRGGGKKPWRQKGTGRARAGSTRSPIWRGGGTVFGPNPRSYAYTMPRKKSRAAVACALSAKHHDGNIRVIDTLDDVGPKTRNLRDMLDRLDLREKTLIVIEDRKDALLRASANLPGVKVEAYKQLNPYDILRYRYLLFSRRGVEKTGKEWKS
jgi:large subunit ribosomal protein L4